MTIATLFSERHSQPAQAIALARNAWGQLTWRNFFAALALGAAVQIWETVIAGPPLPFWFVARESASELFAHLDAFREFIRYEFIAVALLLAVAIADRAVDVGVAGIRAYALAVALAVGLATPLSYALSPYRGEEGKWGTWAVPSIYSAMVWLLFGGLAVFVYVHRKRARATRRRLAGAELERALRTKRALASRLAAMQARVEPQFLFNTLAQVGRLYEIDAVRAENMLEELIAYLRAAMPKMRDTSSTLGQELELVRAYLGIVRVRLGDRLTYEIDLPPEIIDALILPMIVLPLTDHAIVHGIERSDNRGTIHIAASAADGRLRLAICHSGGGSISETQGDAIGSVRERLAARYGQGATLVLRNETAGATEAVLEIPYEPIDALVTRQYGFGGGAS
jgi:Histidine kinase